MRFCLYIHRRVENKSKEALLLIFIFLRFNKNVVSEMHNENIFSFGSFYFCFIVKGKVDLRDRLSADSCVVTTVTAQESARNLSIKMTLVKGRFSGFLIKIS